MSRLVLVVPILTILLACTRGEKSQPAETPAVQRDPAIADAASDGPDATSRPAPKVDVRGWVSDWPKSWTDPRVVAALAEDCELTLERRAATGEPTFDMGVKAPDLFTCSLGYEQSCNPHPCNALKDVCEGRCQKTCTSCGEGCVTSCSTCKKTCTDDACRKKCGMGCAECKQACTRTMDRCASGDCSKASKACTTRIHAVWVNAGCNARCATFERCEEACESAKDVDVCREGCAARIRPGGKACAAKCAALPDTASSDEASLCNLKCAETAPCPQDFCPHRGGSL